MDSQMTGSSNDSNTFFNIPTNISNGQKCTIFEDDFKCDIVVTLKNISASLSIIGALFTMGLIILFKKYREPSQRMIGHLSFASFFYGVGYVIQHELPVEGETTWRCKCQAVMISLFVWACFLWTACMLFNLYFQLLFGFEFRKYEPPITAVCWILPVIVSLLPFSEGVYGPAGAWCWVTDHAWRLGLWYIWRTVFMIIFVAVIVHISWKLRQTSGLRHETVHDMNSVKKDVVSLRIYPVVYFIFNIFPIMNRLYNALNDGQYSFTLLLLQGSIGPLFGLAITLVYAFDSRTRAQLNRKDITKAFLTWTQGQAVVKEYSGTVSASAEKMTVKEPDTKAQLPKDSIKTISVPENEFEEINLRDTVIH